MRGNGTAYRLLIAVICTAVISPSLHGQEEREYIRKGNRLYKKSEFAGSEGMYRRAQEDGKPSGDAVFNLGDALYRQNRYGEAAEEFSRAVQAGETDSLRQADGLYNLGNSLLKEQKFSESINAYINSLKLNPDNIQAKYNLAYAQDQLKKQEEQQQQQDQQDQDKNRQDQQNKDQEDKKDQEQKDDQQQQQQDQQNNQQQQQSSMSREDAKRLLDALAANEKQTQEKVQRDKAAGARVRVIKNW
ncbi:MAG TPA: tetratricopeptide repeat protein [Bacteroidales bacterium]|jgi:tetratricopeptide (TPR) repeat protein|nr:tetratricopeptide repeat protein [Bacteroidales bacterium]HNX84736.1 tetratricopeptide repeat protein [Bacteroidales bacterium]HOC47411.1 tetratricopeptide repeat protein [Bacteroidales bacterium]HPS96705.1 tetratricopeptide repeat protein [Bacteroidales bacterium]